MYGAAGLGVGGTAIPRMHGGERCLDNGSGPRKRLASTSEVPFLFAGVPRGGTADLAKPGTTPITPLEKSIPAKRSAGRNNGRIKGPEPSAPYTN